MSLTYSLFTQSNLMYQMLLNEIRQGFFTINKSDLKAWSKAYLKITELNHNTRILYADL